MTHEEIENLTRPTASEKTGLAIKNLPTRPTPDDFNQIFKFYQIFKK